MSQQYKTSHANKNPYWRRKKRRSRRGSDAPGVPCRRNRDLRLRCHPGRGSHRWDCNLSNSSPNIFRASRCTNIEVTLKTVGRYSPDHAGGSAVKAVEVIAHGVSILTTELRRRDSIPELGRFLGELNSWRVRNQSVKGLRITFCRRFAAQSSSEGVDPALRDIS